MEFLIIWLAFAVACALVAGNKGRSAVGWFVLGVFFSFFALVVLLLLPSTKPRCVMCMRELHPEARICPFCKTPVTEPAQEQRPEVRGQNKSELGMAGQLWLLLKVTFVTVLVLGGFMLLLTAGWVPVRPAHVGAPPASSGAMNDKPKSSSRSMTFEQCLQLIRSTAGQLGVAPVNIVETDALRMVRFCTTDGGSVLVSCSRPDQKMVLTRSPHGGGCD